jgi:hypothetical protein
MADRIFDVKLNSGANPGPYDIYYNNGGNNILAKYQSTSLPTTNVTYNELISGTGVRILIPIDTLKIILYNTSTSVINSCPTNTVEYNIPISLLELSTEVDCITSTITLTVSGGVGNYEYSIDNGTTYTSPTSNLSHTFTDISNAVFPKVRDSRGVVVSAPEVNCNVSTTFEILSIDDIGTGILRDSFFSIFAQRTSITATRPNGTDYTVTAVPTNDSTFLGWTLSDVKSENVQYITTNTAYTHKFVNNNEKIYAAVKRTNVIKIDFCYYDPNTTNVTENICKSCPTIVSVYFNESSFYSGGLLNIIWSSSPDLNTTVSNGYYRAKPIDGIIKDFRIYNVSSGIAVLVAGGCSDTTLTC